MSEVNSSEILYRMLSNLKLMRMNLKIKINRETTQIEIQILLIFVIYKNMYKTVFTL